MVPLSPLVTIGDIPFRWRFQLAYHHRMAPMEPFKWRHWSPMVIAIGSNGDRHWCQWRWGAPLASLRPPPLGPMDRHWHYFLSPLAQWREPQIVMTLLPGYLYWIRSQEHLNIITSLSLNFLLSKRSPIEIIMLGHFEQISAWIFKVMLYNGSSVEITKYLFDRHERWRRS